MRYSAPFVQSSFVKAFQNKKPPRTWIFKRPLSKLFKTKNLQERESLSIFEWGSCDFGSEPKLSLLHLIFILCRSTVWSFLILLFCNLFVVFNYWVCNWVGAMGFCTSLTSAEGFRRGWVLRGAVLLADCKCCGAVGFCTGYTLAEGFSEV